jgi:hypothetical protein
MGSATKAVAASSAKLPLVTAQTVASGRGIGGRIFNEQHGGQSSSRSTTNVTLTLRHLHQQRSSLLVFATSVGMADKIRSGSCLKKQFEMVEPVAHGGPAELGGQFLLGRLEASPLGPMRLLPFSLRTLQRNGNELGETTVNKAWRKHLPQQ